MKGWTFSKTRISETYSYEDFRQDKPADGIEVLIMIEGKDVEFHTSQHTQEPEAGDTIVYFARAENPQSSKTADAPVV